MDAFQVHEEETQVDVEADCDFEIDEDIFSNESYTSDTPSDSSPNSSKPLQTPPSYGSPPPQLNFTLPFRQVRVYMHAQCGHIFQPTSFPGISIQLLEPANMTILSSSSPAQSSDHQLSATKHHHLQLINPRSCTLCTFHESQRIITTTNHTCDLIENSSIAEEYKDRAIAYQNGLESGRLLALKRSLSWCSSKGSGRGGEVARAMEILLRGLKDGESGGLGWMGETKRNRQARGRRSFGSDESVDLESEVEEVVALMQESSLRYCEAEYELRLGDELEEIEYLGKKDGIGLQGRRDEKAIRDRLF
ncbi:hypothetical protein VTL71DRAFT_10820 [Oculimacula yallundae]|uniref:Uncharacterized protein n=1 Tax=Oculimacula yallundae TaxID=86028 RepID=A0ABR4CU56_9HELO